MKRRVILPSQLSLDSSGASHSASSLITIWYPAVRECRQICRVDLMSLVYLWVRLSSGVMESSRWTAAIWCGLQPDRRRTGVSIKINARLWDLFAVTWKTLPGKTMWIQGTSSRLDRLPRLSTQNKRRNRYSLSRCTHTDTHTCTCLHFHHTITQEGVRECARPLPLSLYNFHSSPPPPLHTSTRNPIWISMKSRLFGYPFVDNLPSFWWAARFFLECFLGVSLSRTRWMSHDSIHIWVRVNPHMSLVPSALR